MCPIDFRVKRSKVKVMGHCSITVLPPTPDHFPIGCLLLSGLASVPSSCKGRRTPIVIPNRTIFVVTEKSLNGWMNIALLSM